MLSGIHETVCRIKCGFLTILLILFILVTNKATGQVVNNQAPSLNERIFFGGSFGLQFGSIADIEISPVAGIWVLPRLSVAMGPEYRFYKYYADKTNIYGAKAYTEFTLLRNINKVIPIGTNMDIILHLEDELLSLESNFFRNPPYESKRFTINTILGGGGISQQIGRRSYLTFLILWTLTSEQYGIYTNPDFRISFMF